MITGTLAFEFQRKSRNKPAAKMSKESGPVIASRSSTRAVTAIRPTTMIGVLDVPRPGGGGGGGGVHAGALPLAFGQLGVLLHA